MPRRFSPGILDPGMFSKHQEWDIDPPRAGPRFY